MFIEFLENFYSSFQGWIISVIIAGFAIFLKASYSGYKKNKEIEKEKGRQQFKESIMNSLNENLDKHCAENKIMVEEIQKANEARDERFSEQFSIIEGELTTIKTGQKQLWHNTFYTQCEGLLEPGKIITTEEFEICARNHAEYNNLGGNGAGDELFERVQKKFDNQLISGQ